jgi:hypothetical protein
MVMARPKSPITSRPIHSPPKRFHWMEIVAAVIAIGGAYALSVASTPEKAPQEAAATRSVTR